MLRNWSYKNQKATEDSTRSPWQHIIRKDIFSGTEYFVFVDRWFESGSKAKLMGWLDDLILTRRETDILLAIYQLQISTTKITKRTPQARKGSEL